jgi:hypothetical protein
MSGEANLKVGSIGISSKACVNCVVLVLFSVCGRGVSWLIFCANSFHDLNIGLFHQLTVGRMGWLCFMDFYEDFFGRGRGVIFNYFHLETCGICVLLLFIIFRI